MNKRLKYFILMFSGLLIRLIPFRAPNLEPLMAMQMPISKSYNKLLTFLFGFLSIVFYDAITAGLGSWTLVSGIAYGLVGLGASLYFKNKSSRMSYATYAIFATLAFDAATGLTMGPIFFGQPFMEALTGQIPFTMLHLLSNVSFAFLLSPYIAKWIEKPSKIRVLSKTQVA